MSAEQTTFDGFSEGPQSLDEVSEGDEIALTFKSTADPNNKRVGGRFKVTRDSGEVWMKSLETGLRVRWAGGPSLYYATNRFRIGREPRIET